MTVRLEHANLCVHDVDAEIAFLQTAFPEFRIRHEGVNAMGTRWVHVGTGETYIALNGAKASDPARPKPYSGTPGVNHLAYEVDDAKALRERMLAKGYRESTVSNAHPFRTRIYFYDPEGNDWEFVEYLTDDLARRNDYDLPDR